MCRLMHAVRQPVEHVAAQDDPVAVADHQARVLGDERLRRPDRDDVVLDRRADARARPSPRAPGTRPVPPCARILRSRGVLRGIADGAPGAGLGHLAPLLGDRRRAARARAGRRRARATARARRRRVDGVVWAPLRGRRRRRTSSCSTPTRCPRPIRARSRAVAAGLRARRRRGPAGHRAGDRAEPASLGGLRHAPLRAAVLGTARTPRARARRARVVTTGGGALRDAGAGTRGGGPRRAPGRGCRRSYGPSRATFEPPPGVELVDAPTSLLRRVPRRRRGRHRGGSDLAGGGRDGRGDGRAAARRQPAAQRATRWPRPARRVVVGPDEVEAALGALDLARRRAARPRRPGRRGRLRRAADRLPRRRADRLASARRLPSAA